ncbi:hypothetical protein A3F37_03425 [Candidatus Saccharibacteria bacterium RIFCSPHIGHO2_12_FULL_41_12]|nr:MAG: hypothetical protein A3F37_03425 [Candidatus Saccharibacteria bacterium RIFCSPHIGHO2_12_FULL_41_12]
MKNLLYKFSGNNDSGFIIPTVLSLILALTLISASAAVIIDSNLGIGDNNIKRQQAFNISEAGLNYYLWHLSHNGTDYKDGGTTPATPDPTLGYGPYVHDYYDDNAKLTGTYTLWIKPQGGGSTVVKIRSIGEELKSHTKRTLEAEIGSPSYASYSIASDSALWFGANESTTGPVHSNVGVRMDGASDSDVTSANATYVPSTSIGGDGSSHPGVWCHTSVISPVNCSTRSKVDWRYPVPSIDFNQVTTGLCTMKRTAFASDAATSGLSGLANACTQVPNTRTAAYLPQRATNGSYNQTRGWEIDLNNNNTYNLYQVNGENDQATSYSTALTRVLTASNVTIPSSGVIFAEDNVWVRTTAGFNNRVTIGAGRLATNSNAQIMIADDMQYAVKNGTIAIGLVAEGNVSIAPYAPPQSGAFNFEVNASIVSQSGNVIYPSVYRTNSSRCTRGWVNSDQTFSFYGSVATRQIWTWTWIRSGSCPNAVYSAADGGYMSGITHNNTAYDYSLSYTPPPSFPITSSYNILSWREVLSTP